MARPATNLWSAPDRFVGRSAELARLDAVLGGEAQLVTLLGPPGVGKTRLARQFARADREPARPLRWDEVWFADCTRVRDATQAVSELASVLGVQLGTSELDSATRRLADALAARGQVLVVLDNLEQVVDELRPVLATWLERAPNVRWLATSQRRLHAAGEVLLELGPLGLAEETAPLEALAACESVALLCERARAVGAELSIRGADAGLVRELVTLLDGLPLALEMAAARLNLLDLADLVERLRHRFELLRDPRRAGQRHGALDTAIAWAWELLEPRERQALVQCTVFAGSFDVVAAERVIALEAGAPPAIDVIQALRDRSLLQVELGPSGRRLRLLLSIRDYARRAGDPDGALAGARLRHARYFGELGRDMADARQRPGLAGSLERLARERDNLLAVLDFAEQHGEPSPPAGEPGSAAREVVEAALWAALALVLLFQLRGPFDQLAPLLSRLSTLVRREVVPLELEVEVVLAQAQTLGEAGKQVEALALLDGAEARLESASGVLRARLKVVRAAILQRHDEHEASAAASRQALVLLADAAVPYEEGLAWQTLGRALRSLGQFAASTEAQEQALARFRQIGAEVAEIVGLMSLSWLVGGIGEVERALALAHQSLVVAERSDSPRLLAYVELGVGVAALEALQLTEADRALGRSFELYLRAGDRQSAAYAPLYRADVRRLQGRRAEAEAMLERATELATPNDPQWREGALQCRMALAWEAGDLGRAAAALDERTADNATFQQFFAATRAALAYARGDVAGAEAARAEALALAGQAASPLYQKASELYLAHADAFALRAALAQVDDGAFERSRSRLVSVLGSVLSRSGGGRDAPAAPADRAFVLAEATRHLLDALPSELRPALEAEARDAAGTALVIALTGSWFRPPGGAVVTLEKRPQLARLLAALVAAHRDGGRALPGHEIVDLVWPAERMLPEAATERLYWVVKALRKAGLGQSLVSSPQGYLLADAPEVVVAVA